MTDSARTEEIRARVERFCIGCGSGEVAVTRSVSDFCAACWMTLQRELDATKEHSTGPRFFATYWTGDSTIGVGIYVAQIPAAAMAEAIRTALRNDWLLLRLDIQRSLTNIYVHKGFNTLFKSSHHLEPIPYDADKYGPIPSLFLFTPSELSALREEVERLKGGMGEVLSKRVPHSGLCVAQDKRGRLLGVTAESCKCQPEEKRWRAALSPSPAQQEEK